MLQPRRFVGSGNDGFTCVFRGLEVPPITSGGYRNHCPRCLHSLHVDESPGDRASSCGGLMEPAGVRFHSRKGVQVVHRCRQCGQIDRNRVVTEGEYPDALEQLTFLSCLPTHVYP